MWKEPGFCRGHKVVYTVAFFVVDFSQKDVYVPETGEGKMRSFSLGFVGRENGHPFGSVVRFQTIRSSRKRKVRFEIHF